MNMQKEQYVQNIAAGDAVSGLFLLTGATLSQSRNGPFWRLELADVTGSVDAKIWNPLSQSFPELPLGVLVFIEGKAGLYRERMDITLSALEVLTPEAQAGIDLTQFIVSSEYSVDAMFAEVCALCAEELTYEPWQTFALSVLNDPDIHARLLQAPAAKAVHHAYAGGLLEHMLSVVRLSLRMAEQYPDIDKQVLLVGALFHDLGKLWELTAGLSTEYSDEGKLLGHIELGLEHMRPFLEEAQVDAPLALHFQHLVLSHHGLLEYGSPRLPQTAEAFLLHYADNIDAKVNQCKAVLEKVPAGEAGWSGWVKTLERAVYRPLKTSMFEGETGMACGKPEKKKVRKEAKPKKVAQPKVQEVLLPSLLDIAEEQI